MRFERNRTGLPLWQWDRRREDPTGIEATLEGTEPGGVVAISPDRLFAILRAEQVGVTARQGERDEALPEILRPAPVRHAVIPIGLPTRDAGRMRRFPASPRSRRRGSGAKKPWSGHTAAPAITDMNSRLLVAPKA
jgi:hypothetical protein